MKKIKRAIFLLLMSAFFTCNIYSQINLNVKVSASNYLRYGIGREYSAVGDNSKKYFEELGDVRLFVNDFTFGARYEFDDPLEFGKGTKGISRRYFEFKKEDFSVKSGNFFELFAKGLTLNSFESRPVAWNSQVDGVRLNYKHSFGKKDQIKFNGTILGGGINFTDFTDTSRTEVYSIRAANLGISPFKMVTIGGSYLYAEGQIPTGNIITNISAEIFEGNFAFNHKGIDLFLSYAGKVTISKPNSIYPQSKSAPGDGAYGTIAYTR